MTGHPNTLPMVRPLFCNFKDPEPVVEVQSFIWLTHTGKEDAVTGSKRGEISGHGEGQIQVWGALHGCTPPQTYCDAVLIIKDTALC